MGDKHGGGFRSATEETPVMQNVVNAVGSPDMNVDGSVVPVTYSYAPPAGKQFIVCALNISMSSSAKFENELFAHVAALTNGISIRQNGVEIMNIKSNRDLTTIIPSWGHVIGNEGKDYSIAGDWNMIFAGECQGLKIRTGNKFEVVIQDDLTFDDFKMRMLVKGHLAG